MILTYENFTKGNFKIPNVEDTAPNSDLLGNKTEIDEFIEEYEPQCGVLTLGYELYTLLEAELDPNEPNGLKPTADPRFDKLLNGDEKYKGLRPVLIPYVYFHFLENDESHYAGVGIVQESANGAERFAPLSKAVKAWRTFYLNAIGVNPTPMAWQRSSINGNLTCYDWYGTGESLYTPLYTYLKDNKDVYPEAISTLFENMNYYGV